MSEPVKELVATVNMEWMDPDGHIRVQAVLPLMTVPAAVLEQALIDLIQAVRKARRKAC